MIPSGVAVLDKGDGRCLRTAPWLESSESLCIRNDQMDGVLVTMRIAVLLLLLTPVSCGGAKTESLGLKDSRLSDCPESPNCVTSQAGNDKHRVPPYRLKSVSQGTWDSVQEQLATMPRTTVVSATDAYLHAECRSRFFGFVDDLELYYRPDESLVHVRSASRVGYSDLGANRQRVAELGERLRAAGLIE